METEVRNLFNLSVESFAERRKLEFAVPNIDFNPSGELYLKTSVIPVSPHVIGVCYGSARYKWLCQISVYSRDGIGELAATRIVDDIRSEYRPGRKFEGKHTYTVVKPAMVAPAVMAMEETSSTVGWFFFPVQIKLHTIL